MPSAYVHTLRQLYVHAHLNMQKAMYNILPLDSLFMALQDSNSHYYVVTRIPQNTYPVRTEHCELN